MLQSYNPVQEVQILLYLTAFILGFQLATYIFYRFYKLREERLQSNRILLSYGSFFLLIVTGIFILTINLYFIQNLIFRYSLYKLGYIFILFSPILFLYFILIDEFSKFISLKIGRIIMITSFIPIIVVFLIPSPTSPIFLFSTLFTLVSLIYILSFQIRLISSSVENIKKRMREIFIGVFLSVISLFFVSENILNFYFQDFTDFLFLTSIILLIAGLLVTLIGVYDFPAFYEFKWQENLLKLFIINEKNNNCLYSHDFSIAFDQEKESHEENGDLIIYSGITGIDLVISAITNKKGEKINKIKYGDSFILIEYGSDFSPEITFALIVKNDLPSNHHFLRTLKKQFESFYKEILIELEHFEGTEQQLFGSFSIILKNLII